MIFVNFKTYEETSGENGMRLLNIIGETTKTSKIPIIPVIQPLNIAYYSGRTLLPLWVQHIDPITFGAHTGGVLPEEVIRLQAKGTFLNHSEKPLNLSTLTASVKRAKDVGLSTLVFAKDLQILQKVLKLRPDYVAYEPPELVGSTSTSVSEAKPEIIYEASELCKNYGIPLIVGAGIHSTEDIKIAVERGAIGVAVATDIVKSPDPAYSLQKLLDGFSANIS